MITPTDLADKARELHAHPTIGSLFVARELADLVLAYEAQCDRQFADALALWQVHDAVPEVEWEAGQ